PQLAQRSADVGGQNIKGAPRRRRCALHRQRIVHHHDRHLNAGQQIVQFVGQLHHLEVSIAQLFVQRGQLFVGRLQFFLRRLEFFVGRLQFFIARLNFFVGRLQFFIGRVLLFEDGLQRLFGCGQFATQLSHVALRSRFSQRPRQFLSLGSFGGLVKNNQ